MELQGKYSVYVVDDSSRIQARSVTVGPTYHNFWLIQDGLEPGEKVVYEGLQKVRPGVVVQSRLKDVAVLKQDDTRSAEKALNALSQVRTLCKKRITMEEIILLRDEGRER